MTDSSPKKSPVPEIRDQLVRARDDVDRAIDDHVQAASHLALANDELAGRELLLAGHGRQPAHRIQR